MNLFECTNHTEFLNILFPSRASERGLLSRISKALGVHPSYLSRAIKGENNLTLDQGHALAQWLLLSNIEKEYLLTLIQRDRSGSQHFKSELKEKLRSLRAENLEVGRTFSQNLEHHLSEAAYYSSWIYSAVHILISLPNHDTVLALQASLQVDKLEVLNALEILQKLKLATELNEKWKPTHNRLFISNKKKLAHSYHASWSDKLNANLSSSCAEQVRYTGVHSISKNDWNKLQKNIKKFLQSIDVIVEPSEPETLIAIRIDACELLQKSENPL